MRYRLCENCSLYFEEGKAYCKLCGHPLALRRGGAPDPPGGPGRRPGGPAIAPAPECGLDGLEGPGRAGRGAHSRAYRGLPGPAARRGPALGRPGARPPGGAPPLPGRAPAVQGAAAEAERLNAEGIAVARAGRFAEAERAFLAAVEAQPDSPKARNNLGILY